MTFVRDIAVEDVQVGRRLIGTKPKEIESLMDSIQEIGLLNPITVYVDDSGCHLVAGLHRLTAFRRLNRKTIPALELSLDEVARRLVEVDENLIRQKLTQLERGTLTAERRRLYLLRHPETVNRNVRGGPGRGKKTTAESAVVSAPSFARDTSDRTGRSERSVREDAQIGEKITPEVHDLIEGTDLEDNRTELLNLTRIGGDVQRSVAERIATGKAKTVKQALQQEDAAVADLAAEVVGGGPTPSEVAVGEYYRIRKRLFKALTDLGLLDQSTLAEGMKEYDWDSLDYELEVHRSFVEEMKSRRQSGLRRVK